ncbi:serine protease grass-like [Drosophila ficusphila]|uniref:serine protease grass-like n=1 Tax=Drosophila ficusphila TaxID=30025 RepID=UPI0007E88177|nr:serine protease grass-like [Drosophila ficusphila]
MDREIEACPEIWKLVHHGVSKKLKQQHCGVRSLLMPQPRLFRRITGGRKSLLMSQPWMAFIYLPDDTESCRCGGSLISPRFVLTAAHCNVLCARKNDLRVRLGELDLNSDVDCDGDSSVCAPPAEEFGIKEWIVHEYFDHSSGWNDIALIRLNRPALFKEHIQPICLPLSDELLGYTSTIGNAYWAVGWGSDREGYFANSTMQVSINTKECLGGRDESFLCADGNCVDTCPGDSGGPLTQSVEYLGSLRFVQFGVVSLGHQDCGAGLGAYYMDVPTYVPWILNKLAGYTKL